VERDEALRLLRGGAEGIKEWHRRRAEGKEIPSLANADLPEQNLFMADLSGADLTEAKLRNADLERANLSGANLQNANLNNANLESAVLDGANLKGAQLRGANLSRAQLGKADLCDADLSEAILSGAVLSGAKLREADLSGAKLWEADLGGADLSLAYLRAATLLDANLSEANLLGAFLSDANLSGANLSGAGLSAVSLSGADLREANLEGSDLTRVSAYGARRLETAKAPAKYFSSCVRRWPERWGDWEMLRRFGRLPLFGASYAVLILIPLMMYALAFYNDRVDYARQWGEAVEERMGEAGEDSPGVAVRTLAGYAKGLKHQPIPSQSLLLLVSSVLLAVASTIYALFCPSRIKEFSRDQWCDQLGRPLIHYWPISWRYRGLRLTCAGCYILGGAGCLWVLFFKVCRAGWYILQHSTV